MNQEKSKARQQLILLIPFIVVTLVMLPRLISPQFGLLDDARMLTQTELISQGDFSMSHDIQAGRFRPIYWLYYTLIYTLAGQHPLWYFVGNLILFFVLLYELRIILKKMGFADWQILLTSLIFILSMPVIENYYTLGKGEPLQLVFVLFSLLTFEHFRTTTKKSLRWLYLALSLLGLLLAIMVKETAAIMAPIAGLWVIYTFIKRKTFPKEERRSYLLYLVAIIGSILLYFLIRTIGGGTELTSGTYTQQYSFTFASLVEKVLRWMTLFGFYFHFLFPLGIAFIILLLKKGRLNAKNNFALFRWLGWILGWVIVLLPWQYAEAYYLLPFSLGIAVVIGLLSPSLFKVIQTSKTSLKWILLILTSLGGILLISVLPNYYTNARIQLAFDKANQEMLTFAKENIPENGNAFINIETSNEYVENASRFLKAIEGRQDINYQNIDSTTLETLGEYPDGILLMPHISNQPRLTVRAGVEEEFTMGWNAHVKDQTGDELTLLKNFEVGFRLFNLNFLNLTCPILGEIGFCENPDPIIDTRPFNYGWEVYQIQ